MFNKLKHHKLRNTVLIFEILSKKFTDDIQSGKDNSSALKIIKEFFNENTELSKELELYNILLEEKSNNLDSSNRIIDIVLESRKKINEKKLIEEKHTCIKVIKETYGNYENLFFTKIRRYKDLATISQLFETINEKKEYNPKDIIDIRNKSVSILKENFEYKNDIISESVRKFLALDETSQMLSYKILLKKYNDKYKYMNENQKEIIKNYIISCSNENEFKKFIENKINTIKETLVEIIEKNTDNVLNIKLNEISNNLHKLNSGKTIKKEDVISIMKIYELFDKINIYTGK